MCDEIKNSETVEVVDVEKKFLADGEEDIVAVETEEVAEATEDVAAEDLLMCNKYVPNTMVSEAVDPAIGDAGVHPNSCWYIFFNFYIIDYFLHLNHILISHFNHSHHICISLKFYYIPHYTSYIPLQPITPPDNFITSNKYSRHSHSRSISVVFNHSHYNFNIPTTSEFLVSDLIALIANRFNISPSTFYLSSGCKILREPIPILQYHSSLFFVNFRLLGGTLESHPDISAVIQTTPRAFFLDKENSPNTWLLLVDFSLASHRLSSSAKAQHLVSFLPTEILQSIGSGIVTAINGSSNDPYADICSLIKDFYKPSVIDLFDTYFRSQSLGSLTPSQFLQKARSDLERLQTGSSNNSEVIKRFFLSVLPPTARAILAGSDNGSIEDLAAIADKIVANLPSSNVSHVDVSLHTLISDLATQVSALQLEVASHKRSRPTNRTYDRSRSSSRFAKRILCPQHFKFKSDAKQCNLGCSWSPPIKCPVSKICVFHEIYSDKAYSCLDGCTFPKN